MINRILVPLDPSPFSSSAVEYALEIAKNNNAEITGLVILDIPGIESALNISSYRASYLFKNMEDSKVKEAKMRINFLLQNFEKRCKEENVKYRLAERQGVPAGQIIFESTFYDAVVIGLETHFHFETSTKSGDSLARLLDHTATPVYAVPQTFPKKGEHNKMKILICFDGSLAAVRALHNFAKQGYPNVMEVKILMSHKDEGFAEYALEEAKQFLQSHLDLYITTEYIDQNITTVVKEKYYSDYDLFVLGVHSDKGILSFMKGSLSHYLLKTAEKPVVLSL